MNDSTSAGSLEDYRFAAYLSGAMSPADRAAFEAWIATDEAGARRFDVARVAWLAGARPPIPVDDAAAWGRVHAQVHAQSHAQAHARVAPDEASSARRPMDTADVTIGPSPRGSTGSPASHSRRSLLEAGGIHTLRRLGVAVGILCGVFVVTVFGLRSVRNSQPAVAHVYHTKSGERATVALVDGSHVILGPSSTLRVTARGGHDGLSATVVGEALFTVAHNPRMPFSVHVGHTVARVLGTTFLVRHYDSDATTRIVVSDGRVAVQVAQDRGKSPPVAILSAQNMCVVTDAGALHVLPNAPVGPLMAWATGRLVFDAVPVREALADIGRAYDVEFRLSDSTLANAPLTWSIATNTVSLAAALDELGEVLEAHFVRTGRVITIERGHTASHRLRSPRLSFTSEAQYGR